MKQVNGRKGVPDLNYSVEVEVTREVCLWNRRKSGVNSASGRVKRGVGKRDVVKYGKFVGRFNKLDKEECLGPQAIMIGVIGLDLHV